MDLLSFDPITGAQREKQKSRQRQVHLEIPSDVLDRINAVAEREGGSQSAVIRALIIRSLDSLQNTSNRR